LGQLAYIHPSQSHQVSHHQYSKLLSIGAKELVGYSGEFLGPPILGKIFSNQAPIMEFP